MRRIAASTLARSVKGIATLIEAAAQPATADATAPSGSPAVLSTERAASASSQNVLFHAARFADDGDGRSAWVAAVGGYPQWWQVDLGAARDLSSVSIDWLRGSTRSYGFDIKTSKDGSTWNEVVDHAHRVSFGRSTDTLAGVRACYVRVDILGYNVSSKARRDSADAAPAVI